MDLGPIVDLLRGRRVVALTGAGCSTESGIPDYRGDLPDGRPRPPRAPIQFREFVSSEANRRRYWARSVLGWPTIAAARPNPAHAAIAALEARGALAGVITQNVDGLHRAAGSRRVIELHGALARVRCLGCGARCARDDLQARLLAVNPGWLDRWTLRDGGRTVATRPDSAPPADVAGVATIAPDGDAELPTDAVERFVVEACRRCGGVLKPDVVFFGENVPRPVTDAAWAMFDQAEVLLVVGSSLTVFSGFRFVVRAAERGVPVVIVNRGPTRGDDRATARLDARAGAALPALVERIAP